MTGKQFLNRARNIDREIDNLVNQRERTRLRVMKITQSYENDGAQMTKDPHKFDRLVELENEINQQIEALIGTKREIRAVINQLKNRQQRMALSDYYVSMMTWEETAVDLHYSFQGVMKLRKQAIAEVEKIING